MVKSMHMEYADIVILGAGIGGYETFRTLARLLKKHRLPQRILVIDRNNYFTFTPMLHEAATGSIEPGHAAIALRELLYGTPHSFLKATVAHIDPPTKTIQTDQGTVRYGYAVLALGSGVNYFGLADAASKAENVRTLRGALRLRRKLMGLLEGCQTEITVTIVGGGFTGVEVAGQFSYLAAHDLKKLYPDKKILVRLIDPSGILSMAPPQVPAIIQRRLENAGVHFEIGSRVQGLENGRLILANGKTFTTDLTIWCAGVQNYADSFLSADFQEKGKIPVNEFLQHVRANELYAVGDIAAACDSTTKKPCPPLGEAAHRQGAYVATHLAAALRGKAARVKPFRFKSWGMMVPVGEGYGVVVAGPLVFTGFIAWFIRRTVYIFFMPGALRKIKIMFDWALHSFGFRYIIELEDQDADEGPGICPTP